jgi:hypothetical protein
MPKNRKAEFTSAVKRSPTAALAPFVFRNAKEMREKYRGCRKVICDSPVEFKLNYS